MNNEESCVAAKEYNYSISSDDEEDKKFVSQAVTFVIGHARNGFVALCASVATLLKEQAKLKQDVESLKTEIVHLKERIKEIDSQDEIATLQKKTRHTNLQNERDQLELEASRTDFPNEIVQFKQKTSKEDLQNETDKLQKKSKRADWRNELVQINQKTSQVALLNEISQIRPKTSEVHEKAYTVPKEHCKLLKSPSSYGSNVNKNHKTKFSTSIKSSSINAMKSKCIPFMYLNGCICEHCSEEKSQLKVDAPLRKGAKVIICGELSGVVCYVGHVDTLEFSEIYSGIQLDEAVGDSDGSVGNKIYFSVPKSCGIFVPLRHISCILKK